MPRVGYIVVYTSELFAEYLGKQNCGSRAKADKKFVFPVQFHAVTYFLSSLVSRRMTIIPNTQLQRRETPNRVDENQKGLVPAPSRKM